MLSPSALKLKIGSGDWIRTSDLVVTTILCFRIRLDYLIILVWMQGAYEGLLLRTHLLVSEPSKRQCL